MIGLIGQQIEMETSPAATGPKFVSPVEDKQAAEKSDDLSLSKMVELAMTGLRDLLGDAPEEPPKSSLEQLRSRGNS